MFHIKFIILIIFIIIVIQKSSVRRGILENIDEVHFDIRYLTRIKIKLTQQVQVQTANKENDRKRIGSFRNQIYKLTDIRIHPHYAFTL